MVQTYPTEMLSSYQTMMHHHTLPANNISSTHLLNNNGTTTATAAAAAAAVAVSTGNVNTKSRKRKQDLQYTVPPLSGDFYVSQQKSSMYAHQQLQYHSQLTPSSTSANNVLYNQTWPEYVRSNSSTPINSPPLSTCNNQNSNTNANSNCEQNARYMQQAPPPTMNLHDWSEANLNETLAANFPDNSYVAELIYDPYTTTSLPMSGEFSASSDNYNFSTVAGNVSPNISASTTPTMSYGDIVMSDPDPQEMINAPSPVSSSSSYSSSSSSNGRQTIMIKSNSEGGFCSQSGGFDQLAAAAAVIAAQDENVKLQRQQNHHHHHHHHRQQQQQEEQITKREQKPFPRRRSRQQETAFTSLNVEGNVADSGRDNRRPQLNIDTQQNYYQMSFSPDPLSSTSSSTPVFFGPSFLDGDFTVNGTITTSFLGTTTSMPQTRNSTFDSVSSTSSIFTADQIMDNPTTVTPAAISTVEQHFSPQPTFTQLLTQTPQTIDQNLESDYFPSKLQQALINDQNQPLNPKILKRRSSNASNPPNIKYEQLTPPTLSPPETPKESNSSPPSPTSTSSPPRSPPYHRRVSMSLTILEEDEDVLTMATAPRAMHDVNITNVANISPANVPSLQLTSQNVMRSVIQQYLSSPNPASLGEKTVMVLTSKVAQKSYGTEKRFLCPPPTTLILGSNWWTPSPPTADANGNCHTSAMLNAPKITVGISGEQGHQQGILEWISPTGSSLDPSSCSDMAFSGKCVSKHLYINDADEKRKRVEVLVKIQSPMGHNFGTFPSKPIKVISKPSKKRQSVKNMELCIHHGTTISLFNRIRSQTVSTKYLGVSMHSTSQNYVHWNGTNPEQASPCFVARTGSWDPFIIWIVDPNHSKGGKEEQPQQPPHPNYPRPPPAAIKALSSTPIPIHYNQPVVLQCLTTGMTSPVMIIRKVDKGSMVIGGGFLENISDLDGEEALGDPVSQLHKVAFQIKDINSLSSSSAFSHLDRSHPPGPGTYLACLGDVVGMQLAHEGRKAISPTTPSSVSNSFMDMMIASPMSSSSDLPPELAAPWGSSLHFNTETTPICETAIVQSEGGKVVRKRRVSTSVAVKPTASFKSLKSRRRGNSLSGVASEVDLARIATDGRGLNGNNLRNNNDNVGALWTEDVTDSAVWTIVGTDCATYTFYSPSSANCRHLQHQYLTPPPTTPVTPIPSINNILTATSSTSSATTPASQLQQHSTTPNTITIYGEHFTRDLMVWFGDLPSPRTEYRSRECLVCWLPEELIMYSGGSNSKLNDANVIGTTTNVANGGRRNSNVTANYPTQLHQNGSAARPILFSRNDGVVFRTGKVWP